MTKRFYLRTVLTVVALVASNWAFDTELYAQKKPAGNAGATAPPVGGTSSNVEIAKADGKYEGMFNSTMKVSMADKKELFLEINPVTSIRFTAEADVGWLSPGQLVRFSTTMDNGKITAPLKTLEAFFPAMGLQMSPEKFREQTPGVYQVGQGTEPGKKPPTPPANQAISGGQKVRVVALIQAVQKNSLTLVAGQQPIVAELAPGAKVSVTASDLASIAQNGLLNNGDGIMATGVRNTSSPQLAQRINVETLEIKAAKKLTQQVQTSQRGGKRTNSRTKPGDADAKGAKDGKGAKDPAKPGQPTDPKKTGATKPK